MLLLVGGIIMKKNQYKLEGLTCAHCAMKIEDQISNHADFKDVSLNFATQTLTLKANQSELIESLQTIVDSIEDGVVVKAKVSGEKSEHEVDKMTWLRLGFGSLLFIIGLLFKLELATELLIFGIAYIVVGGDVLLKAGRNIVKGKVFDENFLMSIATIGAFAIGEFAEGVTVMLFYQIGELFQEIAVHRSRQSITSLMDIRPDVAWIKVNGDLQQIQAEDVGLGDIIVVKPGERIPLDGLVVSGSSMVDTSALTGESVPRSISVDDMIISGVVNQTSVLEIKTTKLFGDSTVSKILDLVENASNKKAKTEKFITKFARYYTPVVVYLALIIAIVPPLLLEGAEFSDWIRRALIFLVVSCPCALVISIPLGFFGGIGGASKHGVLIKGSNYLEALNNVKTVVFDKTGTLTKGVFKVTEIMAEDGQQDQLLSIAAKLETHTNHPIGKSILKAYEKTVSLDDALDVEEIAGKGLKGLIGGQTYYVGNEKLMSEMDIDIPSVESVGTLVYVASQSNYLGYILISDEVKQDSKSAIKQLKSLGVDRVVMLTGDHRAVAEAVGNQVGVDLVYSELLPHEKVEKLEELLSENEKSNTIFVGDGINDAPVLARADVGVAMGGIGSDAAIEAADVVLMTDEPSKLADAIKVAKRTRQIVWQNIIFAMGVKGIVLILGAGGLATMWEAVFADVGVALIAIINAMRIIKNPLK